MKTLGIIPAALSLAAIAQAQTFNIDFDVPVGQGAGAPISVYGGAAGTPGQWNSIQSGSPSPCGLVAVDGTQPGAYLSRTAGTFVSLGNAATLGTFEDLLDDVHQSNSQGQALTYVIGNITPGTYAVFTYGFNPSSSAQRHNVSVAGSTSQAVQNVGGSLTFNNTSPLLTHSIHVVQIGAGGAIWISVAPQDPQQFAVCGGIQVKKLATSKLRFYVDDSAALTWEHGGSWTDAFSDLQKALASVRPAGGANCEVWVAGGFYKPAVADRSATFSLPSGLQMYGGFIGNETALNQRPAIGLTYLNGNIGNTGVNTDNSYTVVTADGTTSDTLLDGFRIHNANNNAPSGPGAGTGGGLRVNGSLTVRDCTFIGNRAANYGGGAYVDGGSATFVNCYFQDDEAFGGSAVYHTGSLLRMYNCEFRSNSGFQGTVAFDNTDGTLVNCWFHGNYAGGRGGAVYADDINAQVNLINCTVTGNMAGELGGGAYTQDGADIDLKNCILWENDDVLSSQVRNKQYMSVGAGSTVTVWACFVQGESGSPGLNPQFVAGKGPDGAWGTADDDCNLREDSPCVEAGSYDALPADLGDVDGDGNTSELVPLDLNGERRVRYVTPDCGAFEYQYPCNTPGDLNGDTYVNLTDLAILLSNFGRMEDVTRAQGDIDGDHDVDLSDLATLLAHFGESCP